MKGSRRGFLTGVAALSLSSLGAPGCRRAVTRQSALEGAVSGALAPMAREIVETSHVLRTATRGFAESPGEASLARARAAWREALVTWKQAQCLRAGPFLESGALFRTTFWPARTSAIDALVLSDEPLDAPRLRELGVDLEGLYALEYLLFGRDKPDDAVPARFVGAASARGRAAVGALGDDVARWAEAAKTAVGDGTSYGRTLGALGQSGIELLANQIAGTAETVARRLAQVRELADSGRLGPSEVEGWPSGASTEILSAQVLGIERLHLGGRSGSLADLTRAAAPAIDRSVRAAFVSARAALAALEAPIEVAVRVRPRELERAVRAAKALEVAAKTDLASALGVTLTFTSADGD